MDLSEFVQRLLQLHANAALLSEAPPSRPLESIRIHSSKAESLIPKSAGTDFQSRILSQMEDQLIRLELDFAAIRCGRRPHHREETEQEFRARIVADYEGQHVSVVARIEAKPDSLIRGIRRMNGREERTGLETPKKNGKPERTAYMRSYMQERRAA